MSFKRKCKFDMIGLLCYIGRAVCVRIEESVSKITPNEIHLYFITI